jgi:transposase
MCLKPQLPRPIPLEVATWGEKHLAADSPYRYVGDTLFEQWRDEDFADLYHPEGKPALSPAFLALVIIFQRYEHLGDRAAVHAACTRLDWKYALHLRIDDDGFDPAVLSEFRTRLLVHQAEARIFDTVLDQLKERGFFKQRGTQRTDSTHVLAVVRSLNRLEMVGKTIPAPFRSPPTLHLARLFPQSGWWRRPPEYSARRQLAAPASVRSARRHRVDVGQQPRSHHVESLRKAVESLRRVVESLRKAVESLRKAVESLRKAVESLRRAWPAPGRLRVWGRGAARSLPMIMRARRARCVARSHQSGDPPSAFVRVRPRPTRVRTCRTNPAILRPRASAFVRVPSPIRVRPRSSASHLPSAFVRARPRPISHPRSSAFVRVPFACVAENGGTRATGSRNA